MRAQFGCNTTLFTTAPAPESVIVVVVVFVRFAIPVEANHCVIGLARITNTNTVRFDEC